MHAIRLKLLTPTYVVDGPRLEQQKDAKRANVEPTDAQAKWQHAPPNFQECLYVMSDHVFGAGFCNKIVDTCIP